MSDSLLDGIRAPSDLRRLEPDDVQRVVDEIRAEIIETISRTGGHLASSLGSVELVAALHYVFDTPDDRLVFDVGHQGYSHKLLTGRRGGFETLGQEGGIAKYLSRSESEYDHFGAGHAGTSISAALGMARAMQHQGREHCAIALIGDGALTAGMAFEALNHAGDLPQRNLVVVLNDNEMSISPNVGALSSFLSRKLSNPRVRRVKGWGRELLRSLPADALHWAKKAEESLKVFFSPGMLFEALGFQYVGPVQGHHLEGLIETFANVREMLSHDEGPIFVHAVTAKGHGYEPAERDPFRYHGVGKFEVETGAFPPSSPGPPKYQNVFADTLIELATEDERIVGITAAMADGTGLDRFRDAFPDRFYDVGIAEQHAVTFAAGLASEGMKPVPAIYSTFLQRAYDQVVHDVCLQNLDVTFALDRAGIVGADGATHQGLFDFAYLRTLPNMVVMAPKDENELRHMLCAAVAYEGPAALRFPRGSGVGVPLDPELKAVPIGRAELLRDGEDLAIVAIGSLVHPALGAAHELAGRGIRAAVLNARFVKPLDADRIVELARRCGAMVIAEEHSGMGGFAGAILEALAAANVQVPARCVAVPDSVIEHGEPNAIKARLGLDCDGIVAAASALLASERA